MAMKKTGAPTKLTVFTGEEVKVLDDHFQKTGKRNLEDFTDDEYNALREELDETVSEEEEEE